MLNYYNSVYMNSQLQFKIARGKASYGGNAVVKTVGEVLKLHKDSASCKGLRILHCANLVSVEGIEECKNLDNVNLSSNKIEKIESIRFLFNLEQLDLKANRIKSLKGIEKLSKLIKIDASQNLIQSLESFGQGNSQIQSIILYQNNLSNLEQLSVFKNFSNIKQIVFEKNNKGNPLCENKQPYYFALKQALTNSFSVIEKVDDLMGQQLKQWLNEKNRLNNESRSIEQNSRYQNGSQQVDISSNYLQYKKMTMATQQLNANMASQKLMHLTQRQHDLERLIDIKDEAIDELKQKNTHLEMTNANFYKESLKKEVEHQRIYGQVAELSKNIDNKDAKINELHRRIEELLKINSLKNSELQEKVRQLQKIRKQNNELRIQSSQVRVISKDKQNRLRELQNKALSNIEDKSQKIEELRRKNEDLMKENYDMQRQQDEYKDRVRQLTQLLKQWEYKYEQKVKEMQQYHNTERSELIRQFESKEQELVKNHEDTVKHLYEQFEAKINALDRDYTQALQSSLQKFAKLKRSYDQKFNSESELKLLIKTVMSKNTEQEQTINECQKVILESRKMITDISRQNEGLGKQLAQIRAKSQIDIKHMQGEVSRAVFDRNRFQQENKDLKLSNQYLQSSFDKLNFKQKEMQEMEQKIENLQTALDAKNVMLDDKNETIDNLKIEIENMQREGQQKIDKAQHQKLKNKYSKNKDVLKQMKDRLVEIQNERNEMSEQLDNYRHLDQEFVDLRDILNKQESDLKQKDNVLKEKQQNQNQLIEVINKLKIGLKNLQEEINILNIEKNKLLNSIEDKQNRWNRVMREKERQYEGKLEKMGEETNKLREIVKHLNQISNLTKGMTF